MEIVFVRVFSRGPRWRAESPTPPSGKMNGSLGIMRGPEHHPHRFADYFVICGLDKDSGLEPDKYFGESSILFSSRLHAPQPTRIISRGNPSSLERAESRPQTLNGPLFFLRSECKPLLRFSKSLGCATLDR